jgi:hypothetical protein
MLRYDSDAWERIKEYDSSLISTLKNQQESTIFHLQTSKFRTGLHRLCLIIEILSQMDNSSMTLPVNITDKTVENTIKIVQYLKSTARSIFSKRELSSDMESVINGRKTKNDKITELIKAGFKPKDIAEKLETSVGNVYKVKSLTKVR